MGRSVSVSRYESMAQTNPIVTVFGASRSRDGDADYIVARELGRALAGRGFAVCTGGYGGMMEAVSRGAKDAGGYSIGVTTEFFSATANPWLDEEIRVETWQERLFRLIELGDGYVACKGGTGTLVEFAVVWEMLNKRVITGKPFAVLGEFYQPVIDRVREVEAPSRPVSELLDPPPWSEATNRLIHVALTPAAVAEYLAGKLLP